MTTATQPKTPRKYQRKTPVPGAEASAAATTATASLADAERAELDQLRAWHAEWAPVIASLGFQPAAVKSAPLDASTLTNAASDLICGACWPTGWPDNAEYASCEHGDWPRLGALVQAAEREMIARTQVIAPLVDGPAVPAQDALVMPDVAPKGPVSPAELATPAALIDSDPDDLLG